MRIHALLIQFIVLQLLKLSTSSQVAINRRLQKPVKQKCWSSGLCYGKHLEVLKIQSKDQCLDLCKKHFKCQWATFDQQDLLCHLNGACYQVLNDSHNIRLHIYASSSCDLSSTNRYIGIAAGGNENVEIIDILGDSEDSQCQNLPDFPQWNLKDAMAMTVNQTVWIFGGSIGEEFSTQSFALDKKSHLWARRPGPDRGQASAAMVDASFTNTSTESILVLGGNDKSGIQKDGTFLNLQSLNWNSWNNVAELPEVYGHCLVAINSSTLLIIGGGTGAEGSADTFFLTNDNKILVIYKNFCIASKHQMFILRVVKVIFRWRQLMILHQN